MSLLRIALWGPLLLAALLAGAYVYTHDPFARDGTELLQVPLSEDDPSLDRVGDLKYLGGLDIPRIGQNIGGLSGLRWDAESGRLLAITDDARSVWITLDEQGERLTSVADVESGPLLGLKGETLTGKEQGDSESLARKGDGPWIVGFERDHRIWVYDQGLAEVPTRHPLKPTEVLGELEDNRGLEAMAAGSEGQLACAERIARPDRANCVLYNDDDDTFSDFPVTPPQELTELGATPTDADALSDGTFLILFRSYSPAAGNTAAIVAYAPDGSSREIATFLPPLTLDNFEGLAVREEDNRTFIYIVSDDNFSGSQRTLLMKFELDPMG
ncbi:MAG: esterase-like activity of phytase family protein [Erythrobacter sp.]|uniref:esterase-like activity of phytase family protein n=1 Tax=Erythrobacter sp. TaxID=1042 RepID=UPI0032650BBB